MHRTWSEVSRIRCSKIRNFFSEFRISENRPRRQTTFTPPNRWLKPNRKRGKDWFLTDVTYFWIMCDSPPPSSHFLCRYIRHVKLKPLCGLHNDRKTVSGPQFRNIIISFLCMHCFNQNMSKNMSFFKQPYVLLISLRAALDKQWGRMRPAGHQFDMPAVHVH